MPLACCCPGWRVEQVTTGSEGSQPMKICLSAASYSLYCTTLLAPTTPIWVDFWIFSDQAQLLDPESAASKEPRSGLVA